LRRLLTEFGDEVAITYVMGGLAREYEGDLSFLIIEWLDAADRSRMPIDPRLWAGSGPLRSSFPACMAVKAAGEQGAQAEARYLRVLREGIMCHRRRLDRTEPLVEEARRAGLDAERFRIDLESAAIVEAFGADLEEARGAPGLPALRFDGDRDGDEWRSGAEPYGELRAAALAAGAVPAAAERPGILEALDRFGTMAAAEIEAVCDLPGPRANAELWRLAAEWRVKPVRVLTGELWERA
jgi:predicted DsbA family dithiol-disulfide isomerase